MRGRGAAPTTRAESLATGCPSPISTYERRDRSMTRACCALARSRDEGFPLNVLV